MQISARNSFKGRITEIKRGAVMAQVSVDIGGGNRALSAIFVDSVDDLGLKVGDEVLVHVTQNKARHFGGEVDEFILER